MNDVGERLHPFERPVRRFELQRADGPARDDQRPHPARQLGRNDCATVLQKSLDEEKAADRKLTELAEARLNLKAAS